jgi:adenosyl cobinamide kinase/adenosyl cobinamide phosphate guanylyltransferase
VEGLVITLVIGGARSGKSDFALKQAARLSGNKIFIATAEAQDEEMKARIDQHRQQRPPDWLTLEVLLEIGDKLRQIDHDEAVVVLDCLTLWLANLLAARVNPEEAFGEFLARLRDFRGVLFLVTNEVGQGIVPDNALARRFRDLAGILNKETAALAHEVYLIVAGIPVRIKPA